MGNDSPSQTNDLSLTRRELLASSAGLAAVGAGASSTGCATTRPERSLLASKSTAPFNSLRDYVAALEQHGLVLRIPRVDQDAYEAAALMYRIRDQHGMNGAPTLIIDEVRIGGKWRKGPLIINESGNGHAECIAFGLEPVDTGSIAKEPFDSYRKARTFFEKMAAENEGSYPSIPPVEVSPSSAPCKEVVLTGDDIDLTQFAFIQCNPADAGRYINTGMLFTRHPKYGTNFGTYRCHLRGPREIGVNTEPGQTGYNHLNSARLKGEKTAKVSIVLSPDPYVWLVSGNRVVNRRKGPVDELAVAGGLAGRPLEIVRSETNDHLIPAHAEMVIEGEIELQDLRPEGPYGEMVGYQGQPKEKQFWMRVTTVTHRRDPWIMNNFTGAQRGTLMAAGHALALHKLRAEIPAIVDYFSDNRAVGVTFVSINKTHAGEGLEIANRIAKRNFFAKIVIVVDADLDVTDQEHMLGALGARWQPETATEVLGALPGLPLDPSAVRRGRTSKIAIDATRQWADEGGPEKFPLMNRTTLEQGAPESFARVDAQWGELIRNWRPNQT